jgi:hypothetical protein
MIEFDSLVMIGFWSKLRALDVAVGRFDHPLFAS